MWSWIGDPPSWNGVWGTSPANAYAAGFDEIIFIQYDGNEWSAMTSPTLEGMNDIWGFSDDDVFAVGAEGAVLHYDGNAWSVVSNLATWLGAIWGTSASDLYAVGDVIFHYDGSTWSTMASPTGAGAVWGTSSSDLYAVGGDILHYDGSVWNMMSRPTTVTLSDVWASPDSDVFAVGDSGTIVRGMRGGTVLVTPSFDTLAALGDTLRLSAEGRDAAENSVGGVAFTWSNSDESVATVDTTGLVRAVANGVTTITAIASGGASGSAEITVDQAAATIEVTPAGATIATAGGTQAFTGVAWDANGNLIPGKTFTWSTLNTNVATIDGGTGIATAVASGQVTIAAEADGAMGYGLLTVAVPGMEPVNLWSVMESPTDLWLDGLWGTASSDVFAVGEAGTILHYNGSAWNNMSNADGGNLADIWGTSANDMYAVGDSWLHYDGSAWSPMSGAPGGANRVWGASPRDVYAVGGDGMILHYDGNVWSVMDSPTTETLVGVWGSATDDVHAMSVAGTLLHFGGSAWSVVGRLDVYLEGIWGTSPSDVYVVGDGIFHYDGSTWSSMASPEGASHVWGTSPSDIYAVGGSILHYDGNAWSTLSDPTTEGLHEVWVSSYSDVFAVGESGTIVRGYRGASVVVTPAADTITALGDTVRFAAQAQDAGGNPVSGVPLTLWSSSDLGVATVDTEGLRPGGCNHRGDASRSDDRYGGRHAGFQWHRVGREWAPDSRQDIHLVDPQPKHRCDRSLHRRCVTSRQRPGDGRRRGGRCCGLRIADCGRARHSAGQLVERDEQSGERESDVCVGHVLKRCVCGWL
jgi:hypothetical protein